jgi:hypothetical protein
MDASEFGVNKVIEFIPNGATIQVTNENKHEYVRLVCQEKMIGSIREQVNAFLEGFYTIIPKSLISIFNEQELELLISGLPDIDIEDLKVNTEYHKYRPNSLQVRISYSRLSHDHLLCARRCNGFGVHYVHWTRKISLNSCNSSPVLPKCHCKVSLI